MHYSTFLTIALAAVGVVGTPIELLAERAVTTAKSTTTAKPSVTAKPTTSAKSTRSAKASSTTKSSTSSFVPAYPYTASVCQVTPVPSPSAAFHCNSFGSLKKPSVLIDDLFTGTYVGCADICQQAQECISFGFDSRNTRCTLYKLPLTNMGLVETETGKVKFANRHCFDCAGTTTVPFTIRPTSTPRPSPAPTSVYTTTKKGKPTTVTPTPTTTFTAGPVNIISGGNFTNKKLGGFQVSLSGATGSFTQLGDHYAYCCTSQLLGLDAVCVLSQNLRTPFGRQYNVGFDYAFINKLPGLSTIAAPFSLGVIQQVLGQSTSYQSYSGRYFALTNPSLFAIAMNVPLGGNAVCLTNITVTPF